MKELDLEKQITLWYFNTHFGNQTAKQNVAFGHRLFVNADQNILAQTLFICFLKKSVLLLSCCVEICSIIDKTLSRGALAFPALNEIVNVVNQQIFDLPCSSELALADFTVTPFFTF